MSGSFAQALKRLNEFGINVHGSTAVAALPGDIRELFERAGIVLQNHQALALFGNGGPTLWSHLSPPFDDSQNPIDTFAALKIDQFLQDVRPGQVVMPLFPVAGVHAPLQRVARFLNLSRPSPLGLDLHPEFGPWFAFRRLLLLEGPSLEFPELPDHDPACASCADKPCQTACPVNAVQETQAAFNLKACATHRLSPLSPCLPRCASRFACPAGRQHQYSKEQMDYHMLRTGHLSALKRLF